MSERACGVRLHPAARLLRWMGRHAVGVCFLLIGVWLFRAVLAGADGISYDWQWYRVWRYLGRWTDGHFIPGPLLDGLGMTVRIALFGLALAVAAGLGAALLRLSPWPVARGMAMSMWGVCEIPVAPSVVFCVFSVRSRHRRGAFSARPCWPSACSRGRTWRNCSGRACNPCPGRSGKRASASASAYGTRPARYPAAGRAPDVAAADQPACFAHQGHLLVSAIAVADLTMQAQC
ncbi:MAG: amino acid ABC transporter permease [Bilophila wadsworthia]